MMKELKELMKKKAMKGEIMDDKERDRAESVLDDLDALADEGMAQSMKKVTVASDTDEGLKEGLEKAEEVVDEMPEMLEDRQGIQEPDSEMEEDTPSDKLRDGYEEEDEDDMSEEEIDEMIEMLMAKKRK